MESEYIALSGANKEAIALNNILYYIKKGFNHNFKAIIPPILIDNEAAITLSEANTFYKRAKHIETHYHSVRHSIRDGKTRVFYVNTKDNIANFFTKPLTPILFNKFRELLGLKYYNGKL